MLKKGRFARSRVTCDAQEFAAAQLERDIFESPHFIGIIAPGRAFFGFRAELLALAFFLRFRIGEENVLEAQQRVF